MITGWMLARLKALVLQSVKGGNGINVTRVGESTVIDIKPGFVGGGGRGGSVSWYEATTKAGLDNDSVSRRSFGQVVGVGSDNGMFCIRNPDNDGWDAINFLE